LSAGRAQFWVVRALRRCRSIACCVLAVGTVLGACSSATTPLRHQVGTTDYLPGVAADVFLPGRAERAPVVVLIPGGAWLTADRRGLRPLAEELAEHGIVAVAATYRAARDGVRFPVPVSDVVCAIDFAVARTRAAGITPGPVIVLGHSSGAHLAALAALATSHFRGVCRYPPARVDGLIGLAGPYDVMSLQGVADPLFGASAADDPAAWRAGNAVTWMARRPDLPALLVHGADDKDVSTTFTTSFADRLRATGHSVRVELVPGAGHGDIYRPELIAGRVIAWVAAQARRVRPG
jgi:acetyl esterase/lipase